MAIATYSDLVSEFNSEIARTETSRAPNLIAQVEADLHSNKDFRISDMQTSSTLVTVAGTATVALPTDILQVDELFLQDDPGALRYMPENLTNVEYSQTETARPNFYTILGNKTIKLTPTPDAAYNITIRYKAKIPALTSLNTTNWLLTKNPNIYLYGCAYFFSPKMKDFKQFQMYEALYTRAVRQTIDADIGYAYPSNELSSYNFDR